MPVIELLLPANMEEIIRAGKYREVIQLLNRQYANEATARFEMLKLLTGLNGYELGKRLGAGNAKQRAKVAAALTTEDAIEIVEKVFPALDFIFGNEKFFVNPFPQFKHKGVTYAGPSSGRLSDQTGEEWMVSHQQQWMAAQIQDASSPLSMTKLRMVVAANYHRIIDGKRAAFSEEQLEKDAEALADLPDDIVMGIMVWYNHADTWWADNFAWLFSGGDDASTDLSMTEQDGMEIRHLLFELSGNKMDSAWDVMVKRSRQDIVYALDRLEKRREQMEEAADASTGSA